MTFRPEPHCECQKCGVVMPHGISRMYPNCRQHMEWYFNRYGKRPTRKCRWTTPRVRFVFAWYDLWVGVFIDRAKRRAYIFPVPMLGVVIDFDAASKGA